MSNQKVFRAVGYTRISSSRQINNESPETQRDSIKRYADANDIEIVKWFYDEAASAKTADREQLQALLKYVRSQNGTIDFVVVYKMSRASRNLESYFRDVRFVLAKMGAQVRSATEPIDDTPGGRFMEGVHVLTAQYENDTKAEYTKDNMKALAAQGYWQHPPPVGYDMTKISNDTGKLRPSLALNSMSENVGKVLTRFSEGNITQADLTRFADRVGLRSRYGKRLSKDSIGRLLRSATHAGYVRDAHTGYELVSGKHPGIIDEQTYRTNLALLDGLKASRKNQPHLLINPKYPLKGTLICHSCGKPFYASAPRSAGGNQSPRYHCSRSLCRGKARSVASGKTHEVFQNMLKEVKPGDALMRVYKRVLLDEANQQLGALANKTATARRDLETVEQQRQSVLDKFTADQVTPTVFAELLAAVDKKKEIATARLAELESQEEIKEQDIKFAVDIMQTADKQWLKGDVRRRVKFQRMVFPRGVRFDSKVMQFGTEGISPLYRLAANQKGAEAPSESDLVAGAGLEPATSWL